MKSIVAAPAAASPAGIAQRPHPGLGQRSLSLAWMMWPAVSFVGAMIVFPLAYAVWISLYDASLGAEPRFVGLGNYLGLLRDPLP